MLLQSLAAAGLYLAAAAAGGGELLGLEHDPGSVLRREAPYMGIRLLDSLRLPETEHHGLPFTGLSGLAWSADERILYALSDLGHVFHLRPVFRRNRLQGIRILDARPLRDARGRPLTGAAADSEGLAIIDGDNGVRGDECLLVSFERRPRIAYYRPDGTLLETEPLPSRLAAIEHYSHRNRGLESVAVHPEFGIITAAERPLREDRPDRVTLYNLSGKQWTLAPADAEYGAITDLAMAPDGRLLVLERIFSGLFGVIATVIHRVDLAAPDLAAEALVRMDFHDGHLIDNFEGLTRHEQNRYFMVSDDNGHPLQRILLFYFEIVDAAADRASPAP